MVLKPESHRKGNGSILLLVIKYIAKKMKQYSPKAAPMLI
jgi:hypothetical protein